MQNLELSDLSQVSGGQYFSIDALYEAIYAAMQPAEPGVDYGVVEYEVDPTIFEVKAYLMPDGTWVMWCGGPPPGYVGDTEGGEVVDPVYPEIAIGEIIVPYPYGFGACV